MRSRHVVEDLCDILLNRTSHKSRRGSRGAIFSLRFAVKEYWRRAGPGEFITQLQCATERLRAARTYISI